ncbi:MAG: VOC family protein [Methanomassiliicoccales archaeon]
MANLYPYIYSNNAKEQAEFYKKALDGEIFLIKTFAELPPSNNQSIDEATKDKIMHLRLRAAGQVFFMSDSVRESVQRGNGMDLTLEYPNDEDAQKAFNGLAEGGKILMPLEKQFWGSLSGMVEDPFGVRWQIATEP